MRDDQAEILAFLGDGASYPGAPARVERIDTHSASVFLAGDRAYKVKRAVRYDYLDFSTLERRRDACHAEVRLNLRSAPDLYLGVQAVCRAPGGTLSLGGAGEPVEWLVVMRRFREADVLDRLAARGELPLALMPVVAEAVAHLHRTAEPRPDHGGRAGLAWVLDGNAAALADTDGVLDAAACRALAAASRAALERVGPLLEARRRAGRVRQCHGDLHLRNLVLLDGRPTPFDAVEFNDALAAVDVLYDLAFLLMDLLARGLAGHANLVCNRYLEMTGDVAGLRAMPLFLSARAAIRAKTSLAAARLQAAPERVPELHARARQYLDLARTLLEPRPARLVAIGGYSGAGKSTLARAVAPTLGPAPGAVVIRSDAERKRLLGHAPDERLERAAYAPSVTARVYDRLCARAADVLAAGYAAVADATFLAPAWRERIAAAAARAGVPFTGFWLEAAPETLLARVARRRDDVSDATVDVVHAQLASTPGRIAWRRLDARGDARALASEAAALLQDEVPS
ncbi:MAG: AAA family ATPase [Acidobacteriota bacterium]